MSNDERARELLDKWARTTIGNPKTVDKILLKSIEDNPYEAMESFASFCSAFLDVEAARKSGIEDGALGLLNQKDLKKHYGTIETNDATVSDYWVLYEESMKAINTARKEERDKKEENFLSDNFQYNRGFEAGKKELAETIVVTFWCNDCQQYFPANLIPQHAHKNITKFYFDSSEFESLVERETAQKIIKLYEKLLVKLADDILMQNSPYTYWKDHQKIKSRFLSGEEGKTK